jgi:hypothetical protein
MERLFALVWLLELVLAVATGPSALAYFRRRRARRDFPRATVVLLFVLLVAGCARPRPPPPLSNVEPVQLAPPSARVCQSGLVRPAMLCRRPSIIVFDGCLWRCEPLDRQW